MQVLATPFTLSSKLPINTLSCFYPRFLAGLADLLENADIFPYKEIPHFPVSTVTGHKSRMLFGVYQNIEVLIMQGRFHAYEGYPLEQVSNLWSKPKIYI